ncbi:hypothetical protein [Massilia sp. TN1-12]|uniref:hypothetical protein n=1 Tax=Massilia paldalensis TaxID=3377675 RepID=UPI00384DD0ED
MAAPTMMTNAILALSLATASAAAFAQDSDVEKEMVDRCQAVAKQLNKTRKLGIRADGMEAFATWRAACAERPPTGPGNVTALCEGTRVVAGKEQRVFFWQMSDHGKLGNGYFACD